MSRVGISTRRVLRLVAPGVIALVLVVTFPAVSGLYASAKDRVAEAHQARVANYRKGLSACDPMSVQPEVAQVPMRADEVDIGVYPAFSTDEAVRISDAFVYRYSGEINDGPPPPPPPDFPLSPEARQQLLEQRQRWKPKIEVSPKIAIDPALGRRLLRNLNYEISHAYTEPDIGFDGTTYLFRYAGKCAYVWSPSDEGSRAFALVELAEAVDALAQSNGSDYVRRKTEVVNLLTDLEADRRRFGD